MRGAAPNLCLSPPLHILPPVAQGGMPNSVRAAEAPGANRLVSNHSMDLVGGTFTAFQNSDAMISILLVCLLLPGLGVLTHYLSTVVRVKRARIPAFGQNKRYRLPGKNLTHRVQHEQNLLPVIRFTYALCQHGYLKRLPWGRQVGP